MPAKYLIIDSKANRNLIKIPKKIRERIIENFDDLKLNPLKGAKLKGELSGYYKIRIGDYRVIYSFDSKKSLVFVAKIEHRQGVYR